jgi:CRP-like cAMP-binding protein
MTASGGVAAGVLAGLPMFRCTPRARVEQLARQARLQHVHRGEVIAPAGERLPGLMAVGYGLVKLSLKGTSGKVLRLVGPGETFGEAVLFLDQPMLAQATALSDTLLVVLPAAPLIELIERDPAFARALLASLCQRLHALIADFEAATAHGARERLAAYLDALAEPGSTVAELPAAKTVVAARLGVAKETLSRLLHQFADEGLITVQRRSITLLDRERLAATARGGRSA